MVRTHAGKKNRKAAAGFLTVEAAFILPVSSILLLLLVQLCSWLYQNCFMHQAAYLAAFRGSRFAEFASAQSYTERQLEELLPYGILEYDRTEQKVDVGFVLVQVSLKRETPLSKTFGSAFGLSVTHKSVIRRPAAYIRGLRMLKETGGS